MVKAVIDVGSNSVLLTVARLEHDGLTVLAETTEVTGLGVGVRQTGQLSEEGMHATLAAVRRAWELAERSGATSIRAAATMAARLAENRETFFERARRQGTPTELLSGEREAELGLQSVTEDPTFAGAERLTIVDVGGHSTELATAIRKQGTWHLALRRSVPIGTLGLNGAVLREECPDGLAQIAACRQIDDAIGLMYLPDRCGEVVALGATGTNLVSIRERLAEWQPEHVHGAYLDYEEVSKAAGRLFAMTLVERRALVGMEPGREATLPTGALILERFLNAVRTLGCRVSVCGWRHALLREEGP